MGEETIKTEVDSSISQRQKEHYDANAKAYVGGSRGALAYELALDRMMGRLLSPWLQVQNGPEIRQSRVFDPMCGAGNIASFIFPHTKHLYLCDISPAMMDQIPESVRGVAQLLPPSDICSTGLPSANFDVIIIRGGLHHLHANIQPALAEINRLLKPGGVFLFWEPSDDFFLIRWARMLVYRMSARFDHETERGFRYRELDQLLKAAGFSQVSINWYGSIGYLFMDMVHIIPFFRKVKNPVVFKPFLVWDQLIERIPLLRRVCFAFIGSARKPVN